MNKCPLGAVILGAIMTDCDGAGVPLIKKVGWYNHCWPSRPVVLAYFMAAILKLQRIRIIWRAC